MKIHGLSTFLLLSSLVLTGTAFAGSADCEATAEACLLQMTEKLRDRGWVGIRLEIVEGGMVVQAVIPESPAARSGLEPGDHLVELNGIPYGEDHREELKEVYANEMKPGRTIRYTVIRNGESRIVPIELARLPEEVLAQWIGEHLLKAHVPSPEAAESADG